ncbi:hypothetical protein JCM11641_008305 [Rhodosporidiobolus odoratus]
MAILHCVLTKLNGKQPADIVQTVQAAGAGMVGKIPGLKRCSVGPPLESTKWRSQGWDIMLFAELEDEKALDVYATHEAHEAYKEHTKPYNVDVLAFDIEA